MDNRNDMQKKAVASAGAKARHEMLAEYSRKRSEKSGPLFNALACAYFSALIVAMIVWGPSLPLYALFALLAAAFILPNHHLLGLSLIIALTIVFERHFTLQGLVIDKAVFKFYLIDIVITLSFAALFIDRKMRQRAGSVVFGWPEKLLAAWLILVSAYLVRGLFDLNAEFSTVISSFKNYFFYPLIYFFVLMAVEDREKLKGAVHLIMLSAVAAIAFIFIGLINGQGLWTEFTPLSTAGTRYLAGTHAFYMALAISLGLPLLLHRRLRDSYFALGIMGLWSAGIALSLMRHLWLALAVGLATIFLWLNREAKKSYLALAAKTALGVVAVSATILLAANLLYFQGSMDKTAEAISALSDRLATVADLSADSSVSWRQNIWYDAKKAWETNPVFGVGFGHVMLIDNDGFQNFEEIRNIHNSPLAIAVQMGLVGLAAFGGLLLAALIAALRSVKSDSDLMPYYIGLTAAIAVFLAASLFQPYLETNLMAIWLWLLLGLLRTASLKRK